MGYIGVKRHLFGLAVAVRQMAGGHIPVQLETAQSVGGGSADACFELFDGFCRRQGCFGTFDGVQGGGGDRPHVSCRGCVSFDGLLRECVRECERSDSQRTGKEEHTIISPNKMNASFGFPMKSF